MLSFILTVCLSPGREPTLCGVIDAPAAGSEERENEQQRRRQSEVWSRTMEGLTVGDGVGGRASCERSH